MINLRASQVTRVTRRKHTRITREEAHQGDREEDQEEAHQGDREEATGGLSPDVASINKELERLNRRRAHTAAIDDMKMFLNAYKEVQQKTKEQIAAQHEKLRAIYTKEMNRSRKGALHVYSRPRSSTCGSMLRARMTPSCLWANDSEDEKRVERAERMAERKLAKRRKPATQETGGGTKQRFQLQFWRQEEVPPLRAPQPLPALILL
eukprot:Em0003g740a